MAVLPGMSTPHLVAAPSWRSPGTVERMVRCAAASRASWAASGPLTSNSCPSGDVSVNSVMAGFHVRPACRAVDGGAAPSSPQEGCAGILGFAAAPAIFRRAATHQYGRQMVRSAQPPPELTLPPPHVPCHQAIPLLH